jgi:hypothetical protein
MNARFALKNVFREHILQRNCKLNAIMSGGGS